MEICLPYWAITTVWNMFLERKDLIFLHLTEGYSQLTILLLVRQHSPKEKEERNKWDYQWEVRHDNYYFKVFKGQLCLFYTE